MARWKTKSRKKLSVRERLRIKCDTRFGKGVTFFGKLPSGRKGAALDLMVDRFIREGSCRHRQSLGSPCVSFDDGAKGVCKRDGCICDLLTEKGTQYWRDYE